MSSKYKCDICEKPFEKQDTDRPGFPLRKRTWDRKDVVLHVYVLMEEVSSALDVCQRCRAQLTVEAGELAKVILLAMDAGAKPAKEE